MSSTHKLKPFQATTCKSPRPNEDQAIKQRYKTLKSTQHISVFIHLINPGEKGDLGDALPYVEIFNEAGLRRTGSTVHVVKQCNVMPVLKGWVGDYLKHNKQ